MGSTSLRIRGIHAVYLAVALAALSSSGCLLAVAGVAAGGAAGYCYCKGKVCQEYHAGFGDTQRAVRQALGELAMPLQSEEVLATSGFIESRTAGGNRVRISLETRASPIPSEGIVTRVCVRVSTFGDQPVSERILDQVGAHLVAVPRVVVPGSTAPPPLASLQPITPISGTTEPPLAK